MVNVGDRVAYVDKWGPGPYHGTVTFRSGDVYHVEWDAGPEGPLIVQLGNRLRKLPIPARPHWNPGVADALGRLCSALEDLYEAGYRMGQQDSGTYFFDLDEHIDILRDEDGKWTYEVESN